MFNESSRTTEDIVNSAGVYTPGGTEGENPVLVLRYVDLTDVRRLHQLGHDS